MNYRRDTAYPIPSPHCLPTIDESQGMGWLGGTCNSGEPDDWYDAHQTATKDFLEQIISEFTDRRNAVDQRSNIIAAVTLAELAGVVALDDKLLTNYGDPTKSLVFAALISVCVAAVLVNLKNITPTRRKRKVRKAQINTSLTWFYDVATYSKSEYAKKIISLEAAEAIEVMSGLAVDVAGLLRMRYITLIRAARYTRLSFYFIILIFGGNFAIPLLRLIIQRFA